MVEKDKGWKTIFSTEGMIIALVTVSAYSYAFLYEAGYLRAFGVPLHLVQTRLDLVFVVLLSIIGAIFAIFGILNVIAMFWPENAVLQNKLSRVCFFLIITLWHLFNYKSWHISQFLVYALLLLIIAEFIIPIFQFRKRGSYFERLKVDEDREQSTKSRSLYGKIYLVLGRTFYTILMALLLGGWLVYDAGRASALSKQDFLLVGEGSDVVVLRIYSDLLICSKIDRKTKEIERKYLFKKLTAQPNIVLVWERIGPLKLKKLKLPIS